MNFTFMREAAPYLLLQGSNFMNFYGKVCFIIYCTDDSQTKLLRIILIELQGSE